VHAGLLQCWDMAGNRAHRRPAAAAPAAGVCARALGRWGQPGRLGWDQGLEPGTTEQCWNNIMKIDCEGKSNRAGKLANEEDCLLFEGGLELSGLAVLALRSEEQMLVRNLRVRVRLTQGAAHASEGFSGGGGNPAPLHFIV
jgi:hypothetical protein